MVRQMDNGLINVFDTIIIILFFYVYKQNFSITESKNLYFYYFKWKSFSKEAFNDMEL